MNSTTAPLIVSQSVRFAMLTALLCVLPACRPFLFFKTFSVSFSHHLREAEEETRKGNYEMAIEHYEQHIRERLRTENRPEWENPYFYQIIIGDLHLRMDDVENALHAYETAESHGVEEGLVSDRFRMVASWYEQRDDPRAAMDILTRYRDRDPLLFDLALDRIARELSRREDAEQRS